MVERTELISATRFPGGPFFRSVSGRRLGPCVASELTRVVLLAVVIHRQSSEYASGLRRLQLILPGSLMSGMSLTPSR